MSTIPIFGHVAAAAQAGCRAGITHYFSRQHISAARFFCGKAFELEQCAITPTPTDVWTQHRAYTTGVIMSVAAGLEASINELFHCASQGDQSALPGYDPKTMLLMANLWDTVERGSILSKYQIALTAAGNAPFDQGTTPFQEVASLVTLRNILVHYKPELDLDPAEHAKLAMRLRGQFPENQMAAAGSLWFPHRCMGAGCCRWAVESAEKFLTEFCQRMNLPSRLPP